MNVSIVGSGYVRTTVAACLADLGHDVVNVEIDTDVVETINAGKRRFTSRDSQSGSPSTGSRLRADGVRGRPGDRSHPPLSADATGRRRQPRVSPMRAGTEMLGEALAEKFETEDEDHLVVVKSTVLPGTTEEVVGPILEAETGSRIGEEIGLAMNPEFLRMGTAVEDFLEPDKVVVGATSERAAATLRELYAPILEREETTLVETDVREAELIKYANNAFLAAKVSLVNELGNVAKEYGADTYEVLEAVGLDDRISERFMRSGLGWGGSCFPKDVDALRAGAREQGTNRNCSMRSSRSTTPSPATRRVARRSRRSRWCPNRRPRTGVQTGNGRRPEVPSARRDCSPPRA